MERSQTSRVSNEVMQNWVLVKERVIDLAEQELERWLGDDLKEWNEAATLILEKYWRSVKSTSEAKKIVEELRADPDHLLHPWSGVFISWIMQSAGASKFKKSPAHRVYIADAKFNRENNVNDNPFWAYRINEIKPEAGDLVCQRRCSKAQYQDTTERPKKCVTYDSIDNVDENGKQIAWRTHCDIVTEVRGDSIDVIGGNVSNSVSRKTIPLTPNGYVKKKSADESQYIAIVKFRDPPTTMNVKIRPDLTNSELNSGPARSERFTANNAVIEFLEDAGSGLDRQVRIKVGEELGLFTLIQRQNGTGIRVGPDGLARLGLANSNGANGDLDTQVTNPDMSQVEARDASELIERISGSGKDLIALAPHGGDIEKLTDKQALRVQRRLGASLARSWRCMGWKAGGGASKRWHITSTEISEHSFPVLGEVFQRKYIHAVAFHGWTEDRIGVGGLAPISVRRQIVQAIRTALIAAGSNIEVRLESSGGLSGSNPNNIVNRITASGKNGVQIEQSKPAREKHWVTIADAVADFYCALIGI